MKVIGKMIRSMASVYGLGEMAICFRASGEMESEAAMVYTYSTVVHATWASGTNPRRMATDFGCSKELFGEIIHCKVIGSMDDSLTSFIHYHCKFILKVQKRYGTH